MSAQRFPTFYRIVRVSENRRLYLGSDGFHWFSDDWTVQDHKERQILSYRTRDAAQRALDKTACCWPARIVPVYVKVTRRPKLHDFAWALRRMREGKQVTRAAYIDKDKHHMSMGDNSRLQRGSSPYGTELDGGCLFATDWQLYEPEAP